MQNKKKLQKKKTYTAPTIEVVWLEQQMYLLGPSNNDGGKDRDICEGCTFQ